MPHSPRAHPGGPSLDRAPVGVLRDRIPADSLSRARTHARQPISSPPPPAAPRHSAPDLSGLSVARVRSRTTGQPDRLVISAAASAARALSCVD